LQALGARVHVRAAPEPAAARVDRDLALGADDQPHERVVAGDVDALTAAHARAHGSVHGLPIFRSVGRDRLALVVNCSLAHGVSSRWPQAWRAASA
jgi:hypothetical protein